MALSRGYAWPRSSPASVRLPSPKSQTTSMSAALTVTVSGPAVALAGGIAALAGRSQNQDCRPVRPLFGLTPTLRFGQGCRELACSASSISAAEPGVGVAVELGTQTTPANWPAES